MGYKKPMFGWHRDDFKDFFRVDTWSPLETKDFVINLKDVARTFEFIFPLGCGILAEKPTKTNLTFGCKNF